MILLTPGPANTTATVKQALACEDACHREAAFSEMLAGIRRDLLRLAEGEASHDVVLFTGSGTCAVDAAVSSIVPPDGRLLVASNGAYGRRMAKIAETYGVPYDEEQRLWHEPLDAGAIARLLEDGAYTHLAFVHHETSTGVLNPLEDIAAICMDQGVVSIVDAISSFGGLPLSLRDIPIDFFTASANKCLQGMPGISMVFGRRTLMAQLADHPPRSYYTSLALESAAVASSGQMRFTPAVQVLHALRQALDETFEETLVGRITRYRENWRALVDGMAAQGFRRLIPDDHESGLLTSFLRPTASGYDFDRHHDLLLERGFVIYPAKAGYEHTFRLGNIGAIGVPEIESFLAVNEIALRAMGVGETLYPEG